MREFDIDKLKSQWQQQSVSDRYDSTEILKMLNYKSKNYVKYVLWISMVEFLCVLILNVWHMIHDGGARNIIHILEVVGLKETQALKTTFNSIYGVLKFVSLSVTAYFVFLFYYGFKKIRVEANLKQFMIHIIKFRKNMNQFIMVNILFLVVFIAIFAWFIFHTVSVQNLVLDGRKTLFFFLSFILVTMFCVFLIFGYYRLVYGGLMKKLEKNLKQLEAIENGA